MQENILLYFVDYFLLQECFENLNQPKPKCQKAVPKHKNRNKDKLNINDNSSINNSSNNCNSNCNSINKTTTIATWSATSEAKLQQQTAKLQQDSGNAATQAAAMLNKSKQDLAVHPSRSSTQQAASST